MSTVRSIERRLYVRRQMDRDMAATAAVAGGEVPQHMEWSGIWTGYMTFAGVAILLLSFVFGIGFSSLNPYQRASWTGVGSGTMIWSGIAILIATFLGAWVSGRTPRTSRRHGMMRGVTLWGLILLSLLLVAGSMAGSAVAAGTTVAGSALSAAPAAGVSALMGVLQSNGINVTQQQAAAISTRLVAGDRAGATAALASDANISNARADTVLGQVVEPAAGAVTTAGEAVKVGGTSISWGIFWIALIGLGCAVLGGGMGGSSLMPRRLGKAPQAA
ncbi:MAG TPA: hypothetical protein VNE83_09100 [Terriglobales bacterium]|nr:hypothetical protein [Terriglobales bacterium]